jgi:hypothetical protein
MRDANMETLGALMEHWRRVAREAMKAGVTIDVVSATPAAVDFDGAGACNIARELLAMIATSNVDKFDAAGNFTNGALLEAFLDRADLCEDLKHELARARRGNDA